MTRLTDIPTEDFPLSYERYINLRYQLLDAARGFSSLGTSAGKQIDRELMDVHAQLGQVWETIRAFECAESDAEAGPNVKI